MKNKNNNKVILNLIQNLQRGLLSLRNGVRGRSRIKYGMTSNFNNNSQAFTLIELLVVVLIIGILASVALAQYKMAVLKAQMVEAITTLSTLSNAHRMYEMATGTNTTDLSLLDIELPANRGTSTWIGSNAQDPDHYYFSCATGGHCAANASNPDLPLLTKDPTHFYCIVRSKSRVADRLCKSKGTYDAYPSAKWGGSYYELK